MLASLHKGPSSLWGLVFDGMLSIVQAHTNCRLHCQEALQALPTERNIKVLEPKVMLELFWLSAHY
jgi:hypothetical protein